MKKFLLFTVVLIVSFSLFAALDFVQVDYDYFHDDLVTTEKELNTLESKAKTNLDKSEVYWRQSRLYLDLGDDLAENDKEGRLNYFSHGQALGEKSYNLHENSDALIWVASNVGRWGQTKGILNSLKKAEPMKDILTQATDSLGCLDSSELWYVMGALYNSLPGGFISFGDSIVAISYMRLAVETISENVYYGTTYQALAEYLHDRNWNADKRKTEFAKMEKKFKNDKDGNMSKYKYYEGHAGVGYVPFYTDKEIGDMSDNEEAVEVIKYAIQKYDERPFVLDSDTEHLQDLKNLLADYES